eukprot:scaffold9074_cov68-Skeletonema_marinoi.AAC.2
MRGNSGIVKSKEQESRGGGFGTSARTAPTTTKAGGKEDRKEANSYSLRNSEGRQKVSCPSDDSSHVQKGTLAKRFP